MTSSPEGFTPLPFNPEENFIGANGPLFHCVRGGELLLGFRVVPAHCNLAMLCHGGMLMTLADMQLSLGGRHAAKLDVMLPTISLSIEFLAPVQVGMWVEGRTELLRTTRNLVFAQCKLTADSELVARASSILKRGTTVEAVSRIIA